jgi:hypothetical protein
MRIFVSVLLIALLYSSSSISLNAQNHELNTLVFGKKLFIKDTTKYAPSFINEFKSIYNQYDTVRIIDDTIYLFDNVKTIPDTILIPTELTLNQEVDYQTTFNDTLFILQIKRINYTSIDYKLLRNSLVIKVGTASLQATFFFGPEGQPGEDNNPLWLNQYLDDSDCGSIIKVEMVNPRRATIGYCFNKVNKEYKELPILKIN